MKKNSPTISVIIPVHNTEKYLRQCLDSVVHQSLRDIEIICIDDGSTDSSRDILLEYAGSDERFRILTRDFASGSAAVPRNMGLEIAKGEYLSILDSDDRFDESMLEKMYNKALANDSDVVMCDNYLVYSDGLGENGELHHDYLPDKAVFSYKDIPEKIFQISNATAWHKLIRRDLVEKNGLRFQEGVPSLDDIYFVNMIDVLAKRISIIDEKLVYYRVENENAQTTKIAKHYESFNLAFSELFRKLKEIRLFDEVSESLRIWTLNTGEWWLSCIHEYDVYCKVQEHLKNDWFKGLELDLTNTDRLFPRLLNFYQDMMGQEHLANRQEMAESIPEGNRIVIYGMGSHGRKAYDFIANCGKHDVVAWCDRQAEEDGFFDGIMACRPEQLRDIEYDKIVIGIYDDAVVNSVKNDLMAMGIEEDRIAVYR